MTAIEFFRTAFGILILAGEGCYLKIFDLTTSNILCECKIFESQAIHGIVSRRHNEILDHGADLEVVIWGGPSLRLLSREDIMVLLRDHTQSENLQNRIYSDGTACTVSDWILDVAISPHSSQECVIVTAHNTVIRAKASKGSHNITFEELNSPSRSILYSAYLVWESTKTVLVAAGTVFGEIIMWQCSIPTDTLSSVSRVLHTFTGHEGSIFGVNVSPVVTNRDGKPTRLLASCSDDRTIRIWELNLGEQIDRTGFDVVVARETGFGGNREQGEVSNTCLAMAMGHASRIWSVEFLVRGSDVSVLSFGEDATTQHWALGRSTLTHLETFAYNTGKHIWSKALLLDGEHTLVTTGGADGKISLFEIPSTALPRGPGPTSEDPFQNGNTQQAIMQPRSWDLEQILTGLCTASITETGETVCLAGSGNLVQQSSNSNELLKSSTNLPSMAESPLPQIGETSNTDSAKPKPIRKPKLKTTPKDGFNKYAFTSGNQVLMTTTFGRILLGDIDSGINWKEILMPDSWRDDLKSYSVIQNVSATGIAFLGTVNGNLFLYQAGSIRKFGKVSGKVVDLFTIHHEKTEMVELCVTTLGGKTVTLFEVSFMFHIMKKVEDC